MCKKTKKGTHHMIQKDKLNKLISDPVGITDEKTITKGQ